MPLMSESTSFTLDTMGRFLCNTLQEAFDSTAQSVAGHDRGFDVIILGGGTFGSAIATDLFFRDPTRSRRILVLEAGPFSLPEHVQNLPFMGGTPDFRVPWGADPKLNYAGLLYAIGGRSLAWGGWSPRLLHDAKNDEMASWPTSVVTDLNASYFTQASEQIGVSATNDFIYGPLHEALRAQLYEGLRANGPAEAVTVGDLPDHPAVISYRMKTGQEPTDHELREWLGMHGHAKASLAAESGSTAPKPAAQKLTRSDLLNLLKLEAPLAVQARTEPGLFPINKFSAVPMLVKAARIAATEADGVGTQSDARKRLMVVPNCHVQELITETQSDNSVRVVGVRTKDATGTERVIPLAAPKNGKHGAVILGLGTIESTRVALCTFKDSLAGRAASRMGKNLQAHLRSNLTIRMPHSALAHFSPSEYHTLQTSALFVKGKATIRGRVRYFHLQITAAGLADFGSDSEADLFKKVPDMDLQGPMVASDPTTVVLTLRGIGEMSPKNPDSSVVLATDRIESGRPAAWVQMGDAAASSGGSQETQDDRALWDHMDRFTDQVALIFANGKPFVILGGGRTIPVPAGATADQVAGLLPYKNRRDGLGTTHHDAGTLWMSDQPADGVTDPHGRIHDTENCYVVGPAILPTLGSPNPMLTGIALGRRTADLLAQSRLPKASAVPIAPGYRPLFDGTANTFNRWMRVSPNTSNGFALINGEIVTYGGGDFGLLYYPAEAFADYTLRVQFRVFNPNNHNSGIFVRFSDPMRDPSAEITKRMKDHGDYAAVARNRAWTAVYSGFEIQIDDNARGDITKDYYGRFPEPDGLWKNRTGAVYKIPAGDRIDHTGGVDQRLQDYVPAPNLVMGTWYEYEIDVRGNRITVDLTNLDSLQKVRTTSFTNSDSMRGIGDISGVAASFIGLQSYPGAPVAYRSVQIKA